jgi:oxysterol-binding protein-related protein 9/10/11
MTSRFVPQYFAKGMDNGFVDLTPEGWKAVEEELAESSKE